ncbi:aminoglycoside phosphotransferase family protein [Aureivirga marina]|uniref:aminoglycoside phosphotransferase family protein n=1 Tax=Aureivirga marina TaxID=1182451 RepID=UPI0018CAF91C|nr:aminoglycoside phosphotransferase family protein [Aureivirga marina]
MNTDLILRLKSILKVDFTFEQIHKGFSQDVKYKLFISDKTYLLRISDFKNFANRKREFEIMQFLYKNEVKCNKPILIDTFQEGEKMNCFTLFSFIEGVDLQFCLKEYSKELQYENGFEAGKDLKRIHEFSFEKNDWKERKAKKHFSYISEYKKINYSFSEEKIIEEFINKNLICLEAEKNCLLHDDFHVGNLISENGKYAGVIDFNRIDSGDFVHDFVKLGWFSKEISIDFAKGQLDGYFKNNEIPMKFWQKYSVYMAMSIFATIVWYVKFHPDLIEELESKIKMILKDHDNFNLLKPIWA